MWREKPTVIPENEKTTYQGQEEQNIQINKLQRRIAEVEWNIERCEQSTAVQVSRNLVLRPIRWFCLTALGIVLMDKLDGRGISRKKA
jgi:hypothetical protein